MATASRPVTRWVASIMAGTATGQSSNLTATLNITGDWEVEFPIAVVFSNVSNDAVVRVYSSTDGGTNYDTDPIASFSVGRISTGTGRASIRLSTGQYVIRMTTSGPDTQTFQLLTHRIITAIENV